MSEEHDRAGDEVVGYPSQSHQQEITVDDHPQILIDELLKVIKGANGMPVMFVPSSDGRLEAVVVEVFQNRDDKESSAEKKQQYLCAWLLLLSSLVATVSFTAGLAPPGGFWANDDKISGYVAVAGTSVMHTKFPWRYKIFYYSNTTAFFSSLVIIGVLAKSNVDNKEIAALRSRFFIYLIFLCFFSLGTSYVSGTWLSTNAAAFTTTVFLVILYPMSIHWLLQNLRNPRS